MDTPKDRGFQHLKNKSRDKNKSKTVRKNRASALASSRAPPKLESNWDAYREIEDEHHQKSYSSIGEDFSILANAPISKGSHFQFKSDYDDEIYVGTSNADTSQLFNLDLNLLALSVASIPFHERCNLPDNYFTASQHQFMKQTAKNCAELYEQSLLKQGHAVETKNDLFNKPNDDVSNLKLDERMFKASKGLLHSSDLSSKENFRPTSSLDKIRSLQIDKFNEIEDEFDRMTLTKQDSKRIQIASNLSPDKYSGDCSVYRSETSKDSPRNKESSVLETESLEEWLDDLLED